MKSESAYEAKQKIYEAQQKSLLMDYNEAYYRWVFCAEKDKEKNKAILDKYRHLYFSS